MPPRVSILTVCRNDAPSLPGCLAGVAQQDWPDLEHVVQDGASTDGSLALLREHGRRADLRLVSEPDAGIHDAVLRGLRRTTGDIVGFSWADESLLPGAVERAVEVLAAQPSLGALYGAVIETDGSGKGQRVRTWPDWSFDETFHYRLIPPVCAAFFRRRVLDRVFLPIAEAAGDGFEWLLWITTGASSDIQRIAEPLSLYAQRPGQLSRQPAIIDGYPARLGGAIDALLAKNLFVPALAERCSAVKAGVHLWAVDWLIRECDDLAAARRHFDAALAHDPRALESSAVPWAVARELLARGEPAWVLEAFERAAKAGAGISGECIVRALGYAQVGDERSAASLEDALLQVDDAPVFAAAIARILRRLLATGRGAEAGRMRGVVARLGGRRPGWRLAAALVLSDIGHLDDALRLTTEPFPEPAWERERRLVRRRLELRAAASHPALRLVIGQLAGRQGPIDAGEAATMADELAATLAAGTPSTSPGLAVVAALLETEARRVGFLPLAHELARLSAATEPPPEPRPPASAFDADTRASP